jgi:hypothetical protein
VVQRGAEPPLGLGEAIRFLEFLEALAHLRGEKGWGGGAGVGNKKSIWIFTTK